MAFSNMTGRSTTPVTTNLIIINCILLMATVVFERRGIDLNDYLGLHYYDAPRYNPLQMITYLFMHGGFWHIFFNMYTLLMFGIVLERALGTKRFLIFYFVTGLGAAALHTGVEWIQDQVFIANGAHIAHQILMNTPTLGASGAIYGVLIGYAMCYPNSRLTLLFPPVTLTAKWFVIIFAIIELGTGVSGIQDGVAHFAHLGGMLFGWLLIRWWRKKGRIY